MRRFLRIMFTLCGLLVALLAIVPLPALSATYTFSGSSLPPCTTWNGAWTVSGTTYTCDASASLAAGDIIAPAAGITVVAKAGWTLGGNNVVGSAGARVLMQSTYGNIVVNGGTTIHGSLVSGSGDVSVSGSSTINGSVTTSSGDITISNTVVNGSLNGGGKVFLTGGRVTGNVSGTTGVTSTGGAIIGGNVLATNGTVTLSGGSVTGSVISNCCKIETTNTNISGGLRSDRNTVSINGGTINGGIYSSGGSGIIIKNATVAGGDITATSVPISITNSSIGSPVSLIDITSKNTISISDSTVNGSVTAGGWAGSLTITGDSDVTISCYPEPVPVVPGACGGTGGGTTIHHYEIDIPAAGLTCENTTLPVRACTSSTAPCTASLATTSTTTTLAASAGTFVNSGGATISFTGTGGYVLSAPTPAVVNLSLAAPAGASLSCFRFEGTTRTPASCQFEVKNSAFRFAVPNFAAGDGAPFVMQAVRQDDHSRRCVSFVPAGGVKLWTEYVNPTSGSKPLSFSYGSGPMTVTVPAGESSAVTVPLAFNADGEAGVGVNYLDAGMVRLRAKWNATEGESTFVVKPYFAVSGLVCGDGTVNPGATGAGGSKFCRAGDPFSATVMAVAKDMVTKTPNFGRETPPESVKLTAAQVSPTAAATVLQGGDSLAKNGSDPSVASSAALSWPEVGVISLTPAVGDGDYLGAGDVDTTAAAVPYVGRFYPHHFSTEVIAPMTCPAGLAAGCPSSRVVALPNGMAYAGQPFKVKVSARSAGGTVTSNYSNGTGYARAAVLAPVSVLGGPDAPTGAAAGTLSGVAIGAASFSNGEATMNQVSYKFTAPPGTPTNLFLRASETAGDGVSSRMNPNSASEEGGIKIVQGRIRMSNVFGNGKAALKMPVEAQYWSGASWVRNTSDDTPLALTNVTSVPALTIQPFSLSAGAGNLVLSAAAAGTYKLGINLGDTGTAFASCDAAVTGGTAANRPWLRSRNGNCPASAGYAVDPSAVATFGIFAPETRRTVHVRELY